MKGAMAGPNAEHPSRKHRQRRKERLTSAAEPAGLVSNFRVDSAFLAPCIRQQIESRMAKALLAAIGVSFALLIAAFVYAAFVL
jgi:hypothetical protein